jgi:RNA polymerase sigma-70 factor (ECF subfamily)
VLINVCRDGWRKRAGRRRLDAQHLGETRGLAEANPEAAVIARTVVWQALQQLPPRRRAAIVLYELEGVAMADIARVLGVSAVTVRWHLSRGRHELARIIGGRRES